MKPRLIAPPAEPEADPKPAVSLANAEQLFIESLVGKSPRTVATYASALRRWEEHLRERKLLPEHLDPAELDESTLEDFQAWLIRSYGREDRATITTYVSGVR